ncbi:hypothetical protein DFH08DRAFT_819478 [Mycena albidolilacea]|uniref:DUF6697 domain-containing protein n=1 Tax=Mycena albidolilacea TaxID=1033008 RepID=A0AAD7EGK0_9AGAR|nr:hypothetical protein DFH08DRAFT_819478 [Mycena albidolilacea]
MFVGPVTRRRPGTGVPVDGSTCPVPVRHETISHRLSDGSRPRQTGPVAVTDGDGSEPYTRPPWGSGCISTDPPLGRCLTGYSVRAPVVPERDRAGIHLPSFLPRNDWRLMGRYNYQCWGEISPHHISRLPPLVLDNWVSGMLGSQWGKVWIERANEGIRAEACKVKDTTGDTGRKGKGKTVAETPNSVLEALKDGRLALGFSVFECVAYPEKNFEDLVHYEENPKPKPDPNQISGSKRRVPVSGDHGSAKKKKRVLGKTEREVTVCLSEVDESEDSESDGSESDYSDGCRRIIADIPIRALSRKLRRNRIESVS